MCVLCAHKTILTQSSCSFDISGTFLLFLLSVGARRPDEDLRPVLVWVCLCAATAWQLLNRTAVPARVCHCSQKPGGVHAVSTFAKLIFQHTEPNKIQLDRFLLIHSMKTSHKWRINARYFPIVAFGVEPVSSSALSVLLLKA